MYSIMTTSYKVIEMQMLNSGEKQSICQGRSTLDCDITGIIHFVNDPIKDVDFFTDYIIVAESPSPDIVLLLRESKAIITTTGGMTCHVAINSRELGIPAIVAVKNAFSVLKEGMKVRLLCSKGIGTVYED